MKSATPKVLHPLLGRTLLGHVLTASGSAGAEQTIVVVGHKADQVEAHLAEFAPATTPVPQPSPGDVNSTVPSTPEKSRKPVELDERGQADGDVSVRITSVKAITAPIEAVRYVKAVRPLVEATDVVVGMGGYVSVPVVLASLRSRRPVVLHEQNAVPGLANRTFARPARTVALAFAEARQPEFETYAHAVVDNARALAEGLVRRGGSVVTGGTDNHLVLLDVSSFGVTGRQAESALVDSGIVTNRNSVPRDPNGAWYTSGVRLGTPALTTRGFTPDDMDTVAQLIVDVLTDTEPAAAATGGSSKAKYELSEAVRDKTQATASEMLVAHPLYPELSVKA